MSRLILVSNRLPVTLVSGPEGVRVERSVGGLATGLRDAHERNGGLWIGWPGPLEPDTEQTRAQLKRRFADLRIVPVYLTAREVRRYYEGFANGVLWPLFHYLAGRVPLRVEGWTDYVAANQRFAQAVVEQYRPGDLIWVHDYQLMLTPAMIRRELPDARIGFFLHIPFPAYELFATLPNREQLLEGLLGADLIGFHTESYRRHCATTLARLLGVGVQPDGVQCDDRRIRLGVFPMGVDTRALAQRAKDSDIGALTADLRRDFPGKLLVGIDRLDYTKGIPRRLLAFEELLKRWPEWRGRVRLLQVAVPSRTGLRSYRRFRDEVDAQVGHLNGAYGTPYWMPVHYIYRGVPQSKLPGYYRAADVLLVTPVRDGMNLVAKEFVAVRDDEDGVLVLSEFAGAAAELRDALLVNPYDIEATAEQYHRALTMTRNDRRARMRTLRAQVFDQDVQLWVSSFLDALQRTDRRPAIPNALAAWHALTAQFADQRPIVFLDYDGTLTALAQRPEEARLSDVMKRTLRQLRETVTIVVVSGRGREDLMDCVGIPELIYAGSHGFDIAGPDGVIHQVGAQFIGALREAARELRQRTANIAGALIEDKGFSVAVHYRLVERREVPQVLAAVDDVLQGRPGLKRLHGKRVLELRPAVAWDKGRAVLWLMEALSAGNGSALPIFIGDDVTDEDAFRAIAQCGIGVVVASAPGSTHAHYSLRDVTEVQTFLHKLAQYFAAVENP
ncbi:MAG: bifunctional alpha,alpha-trehalose-phosphate synthase (UDP-forming)/trehalose-phosphatase [Longimicrobiales bacterium]